MKDYRAGVHCSQAGWVGALQTQVALCLTWIPCTVMRLLASTTRIFETRSLHSELIRFEKGQA